MAKPFYTNDQIVNQIDSGGYWYDSSSQIASTITYGVTTSGNWYTSAYGEYSGWSGFNAKQAAVALTTIELWDDVIASDLVASADPNAADIRFSNSSTGVGYAHSYYPGQTSTDALNYQKAQGSIWLNGNYVSLNDPDIGEYGFMTIAHEIGHSLGLSHPGTYNGGFPTYQNDAVFVQDTHMYSVMSYFDASNTGADWYASNGQKYYAQTPMVYDILTAQSIYGADYTTRSGNTTYGFNSTEAGSVFDFTYNLHPVITIWDGAGIDTLDFSGWNSSSTISLVPGSYSNADQMTFNIAIAYGADIENAIGGGGNDSITGNDLNNRLSGNGGNDMLDGGLGNDFLDGGAGVDRLNGGAGNDSIVYDAADNFAYVTGGSGVDTLVVNGGTVPLSFSLGDHGFETATHNQTDTGSQAWSTIVDEYNGNWDIFNRVEARDNGESWSTIWDVDNKGTWSEITSKYTAGSQLYDQTVTSDTGNSWQHVFDVDNSEVWSRQFTYRDLANLYSSVSYTNLYDAQDRLYDQVGTYDNGFTWHQIWDLDNTQAWERQVSFQDVANLDASLNYTNSFDAQDRLYEQTGLYDNSNTWTQAWDVDNTQAWVREFGYQDAANLSSVVTSYLNHYDSQGRFFEQTGIHDTGNTWYQAWDVDNTQTWARQVSFQDVANLDVSTSYSNFYDDQDRLYDQTGNFDNGNSWHRVWDVNNIETWSEQAYTYDALGNLISLVVTDDVIV